MQAEEAHLLRGLLPFTPQQPLGWCRSQKAAGPSMAQGGSDDRPPTAGPGKCAFQVKKILTFLSKDRHNYLQNYCVWV